MFAFKNVRKETKNECLYFKIRVDFSPLRFINPDLKVMVMVEVAVKMVEVVKGGGGGGYTGGGGDGSGESEKGGSNSHISQI